MHNYQRLKDLREDADKRQADIAEVLGISRQHYSLYERGDRELPMHHFVTLARYYNVSLDYLAGLIDQPRKLYYSKKADTDFPYRLFVTDQSTSKDCVS